MNLFPGYFALVMATGIVAIGAQQQKLEWLADALYGVTLVAYVVLAVLYLLRLAVDTKGFIADLTSHARGFAFLTAVAATNVLGAASGVVQGWWGVTRVLWWVGLVLWFVLLYTALLSVVIRTEKPALGGNINGTWFLTAVATESIAVSGALLLARNGGEALAFVCLAVFTVGLVLYLIVMTAIFMRWTLQALDPTEIDPPAWIATGAVAITVLAGSNLLNARTASPHVERLAVFIEGLVILAWATATFWFPLLVAVGVWRHVINKVSLRYHPALWAMVFPLGMYSASSFRMRAAIGMEQLGWLPVVTFGIALVAWSAVSAGFVWENGRALLKRRNFI